MEQLSHDVSRIVELLKQGPLRIRSAVRGVPSERLYVRTENEPWSISDILVHLRACSDVWGGTILAMLSEDNPTQPYKTPRAFMKEPKYQNLQFATALEIFTQERQKLVSVLTNLDDAGWARTGTYTRTTPRHRNPTVWSLTNRLVDHELLHLEQIDSHLR